MKTVVIVFTVVLLVCSGFLTGYFLIIQGNTSSGLPEHLIITNVDYGAGPQGWIAVTVNNTGIASVDIAKLLVNSVKQLAVNPPLPLELAPDNGVVINATIDVNAQEYQIDVLTSKGNMFSKLSSGTSQQAGFIPYKANVAFGSGSVLIDIGNSGTASVEIVQVYVGTSASALASQTTAPTLPKAIAAGAIQQFNVTYAWSPGNTYYFKVVPNNGAALSFTEQAPQ